MNISTLIFAAISVIPSTVSLADPLPHPVRVPLSVRTVFVPDGFSDTNVTEVVVDGYLPNGCYKVADNEAVVDPTTRDITVTQYAERYSGLCPMISVPFWAVAKLGYVPVGDYQVQSQGAIAAPLKITEAPSGGTLPGGDEFLYVPVESVQVHQNADSSGYTATIQGRFSDTCQGFDGVRLLDQGAVQVIEPIMKLSGATHCAQLEIPFSRDVPLSPTLYKGRHLVHVRALSGQAVNDVFTAM